MNLHQAIACAALLTDPTAKIGLKNQFLQEADFTPSGVVRITKLQIRGYAYIRP